MIPNGTTPTTDARRYSYNAAGFLTRTEIHDGTTYQPQAEMVYNGPSAGSGQAQTTTYLTGGIGEQSSNSVWSYYSTDGLGSVRQ